MPIRVVPDDPNGGQQQRRRQPQTPRQTGGGGGLGSFLPAILGILFKKPKLLLILLIIGAVFYFMGGLDGCMGNMAMDDQSNSGVQDESGWFRGAEFDKDKYDKTDVYAPLADNRKNPLPEKVTLRKYCPTPLNQGSQGSCVGWSSAYAARTIMHARQTGINPNQVAFSPASLYNQISLPNCQGAYIPNAMEVMQEKGVLPLRDFPYDESNCSRTANRQGMQAATQYRTKGFNRLTPSGQPSGVSILGIKQNLAQGAPVVIGMMVGQSFMQRMMGRKLWLPSQSDYQMRGFGGHAMCVIGYDDYYEGGAFEIMNSWGTDWGDGGFGWVKYNDFEYFTKEAFGLYPMGNADQRNASRFTMAFGLVQADGVSNIPLKKVGGNVFETVRPIAKMTKFKIEVQNTVECYTYVFGQETDGSTYEIFPYTKKHSPYCGITGTRVFPSDASLQADNIGSKDWFVIIVTKQPIDYLKAKAAINAAAGSSYAQRINNAFGGALKSNVNYVVKGSNFGFDTEVQGTQAVAMVIGVNKQ